MDATAPSPEDYTEGHPHSFESPEDYTEGHPHSFDPYTPQVSLQEQYCGVTHLIESESPPKFLGNWIQIYFQLGNTLYSAEDRNAYDNNNIDVDHTLSASSLDQSPQAIVSGKQICDKQNP